jgi:two-component system chemotaxis response regulator CheB
MAVRRIRVLVVDDSPLIRQIIADIVAEQADLEVAGMAGNGQQALQMIESLRPDVVTLDIQMPQMDGLETLAAILERCPVPVIMVSSLTQRGASVTLDALDRGALDYVAKPETSTAADRTWGEELLRKIRAMAGTNVLRVLEIRRERAARLKASMASAGGRPPVSSDAGTAQYVADKCIAIGISTGGPPALSSLFEALVPQLPPIVVVQHMPAHFTKPFAWRLNSISKLTVCEAASGDVLQPNHVYIAPGGQHLSLRSEGGKVKCFVRDGDVVSGHKPSVDVMMRSVAEIYGPRAIGIIMTGMGRDGADGCGAIRRAGGYVLAQDESSSDVYGMNKIAVQEGHVHEQFHLAKGAEILARQMRTLWGKSLAGAR